MARIRAAIPDASRAYLTVLRSTDLERRLAVRLGLPLNAADPAAERLCAKTSMRRLLGEAGIPIPAGFGDLRDRSDLLDALAALRRERPGLRRAMVKLDTSFLAEGRALVELPREGGREAMLGALLHARIPEDGEAPEAFLERFERDGGLVEEFVEGAERADASACSCASTPWAGCSSPPPTTRSAEGPTTWTCAAARSPPVRSTGGSCSSSGCGSPGCWPSAAW
jgi:hypothetical protein